MNIHQLSVNYVQEHDRILLRINTTAGEEFRVWLTRRLTLNLIPQAKAIVAQWVTQLETAQTPQLNASSALSDDQTQRVLAQFKREQLLDQADFKTPYKPPNAFPLGGDPLVVTQINVTPLASGQLQLAFQENLPPHLSGATPTPRGFRVCLEQKLVHGLFHLLESALDSSNWSDASQRIATTGSAEELDSLRAAARPKYLN